MKNPLPCFAILSGLLLSGPPAKAELETLQQPWLGYFIGLKDSNFQFGVTTRGEGVFEPLKRNREPVNIHNPIKVQFQVLETMPDGKVVSKRINWDDLQSDHEPSQDPKEPVTFTGKVTGDATFQVTVTPERKAVSLTGKILDNGTLKNPLTFGIRTALLPYKWGPGDAGGREAFDRKIKRDEIRLVTAGGDRAKLDLVTPVNPATAHTDGINSAELRIPSYENDITVSKSENSTLVFEDDGEKPLSDGFSFLWTVNEGADPESAKFTIEAK